MRRRCRSPSSWLLATLARFFTRRDLAVEHALGGARQLAVAGQRQLRTGQGRDVIGENLEIGAGDAGLRRGPGGVARGFRHGRAIGAGRR